MTGLFASMLALGFSAAASSSGLLTTMRVLLPQTKHTLPWWYAAGNALGFSVSILLIATVLRAVSYSGGTAGANRSRVTELVLGLALILSAAVLMRFRSSTGGPIVRLLHRFGRLRINNAWTPRRLLLQGSRLVLRPRGLLVTATAALVLDKSAAPLLPGLGAAALFGCSSTVAIVILIIVFERAPDSSRQLLLRTREWALRNAPTIAASVAAVTGAAVLLGAAQH